MTLVILNKRKTYDVEPLPFTEVKELEIEEFRWNPIHEFEYVIKNSGRWSKLEPNQDIIGLRV